MMREKEGDQWEDWSLSESNRVLNLIKLHTMMYEYFIMKTIILYSHYTLM
jgi:hypothetical protein